MPYRKNEAAWIESRNRWQIKVQADGERKTFTSSRPGIRGKAEAERKADAWLADSATAETARVDKYLDEYLLAAKETKSQTNYRQIEGSIRLYIRPVIGRKKMSKLTEGDLQDVIDLSFARHNLSKVTLQATRRVMLQWLKWCRKRGKTRLHPEEILIPKAARTLEKQVLTPDSLTTLFESDLTVWHRKEVPDWFIHAYRFEVLTGLRPGELRGLEWQDIEGNRVTIRRAINVHEEVTSCKNTNARRTFLLSDQARAELDAQRRMLHDAGIVSPHVFPRKDGSIPLYDAYRERWYAYCKHNNIPHTTLYELRHTFVSITKEMPEGLKQKMIGHSRDMDTEGTYGHLMAGDLEKAADYAGRAFTDALKKAKK